VDGIVMPASEKPAQKQTSLASRGYGLRTSYCK